MDFSSAPVKTGVTSIKHSGNWANGFVWLSRHHKRANKFDVALDGFIFENGCIGIYLRSADFTII